MKTFGFDVVTWAFGDLKISSGFEDGTRNHLTIVTWSDGTATAVREEAINGRPAALTFSKAFCYRYFGSPDRFRNNVLDNLKHYDEVLVYEWKGVYTGIGKDLKTCDIYDFVALAITSALYGSTYQVDEILEKYMDISYDMRKGGSVW